MIIVCLKKLLILILFLIIALVVLALATHKDLPDNSNRKPTTHLPIDPTGTLATKLIPVIEQNRGLSGLYLLDDSHEAFLARLALANTAQKTLDVQYYIWQNDTTGHLLMQSLYDAAERGVRVRLLLDDNNTDGMDDLLASVNAHPNIEIRLFNPFMHRRYRFLGYLSDFFRLNRRMHNKSFTADGLVTITGGRNVGDEYFGFGTGVMFADLDVAAVGPVAKEVEVDFDRYWSSQSAYPAENILNSNQPAKFNSKPAADKETQVFLNELQNSKFVKYLRAGSLPLVWTSTKLISDDPKKGLQKSKDADTVLSHIAPLMQQTKNDLLIISPYFVPTKQGGAILTDLALTNKQVTVLTNSLAATDVMPVHAGYVKYRRPLIKAGVSLYELKPKATVTTRNHGGIIKSSGASLHAKTFIIDNQTLFIGSFNMDPRSATLNTEMGLIFDSPTLANYLSENMQLHQMQFSYLVDKTPQGKLLWQTEENNQIVEYDNEPHSSFFQRLGVAILALLPIEWLL